jgi:hypothetical protein
MSAPDFAAIAREWLYAMNLPDNREDSLASRLRDVHAEWTAAEREACAKWAQSGLIGKYAALGEAMADRIRARSTK